MPKSDKVTHFSSLKFFSDIDGRAIQFVHYILLKNIIVQNRTFFFSSVIFDLPITFYIHLKNISHYPVITL